MQASLQRSRAAGRRQAAAWLLIASLLGLGLGEPFHLRAALLATPGSVGALAAVAVPADGCSQRAVHDPSVCLLCRATAQTRLALRTAAHAGTAADGSARLLHLLAPAPPSSALALASARPRAPPASLLSA